SVEDDGQVVIFYRGAELKKPVRVTSSPDLAEIAARLGGEGPVGNTGLDFSYADVVAILQGLVDGQKVSGLCGSQRQLAAFVLQTPPTVEETAAADSAKLLRDSGRPQTDRPSEQKSTTQPDAAEQRAAEVG